MVNVFGESFGSGSVDLQLVKKVVATVGQYDDYLSLQKNDGSSCSAWACGMLSKELLQNPMKMVSSRLFVLVTGKKTSKANGRVYNSYKLVTL